MAMSSLHYNEIWSHPNKSLKEHLTRVGEIAKSSASAIPLHIPNAESFIKIVYLVGLYHDIGKATPFFQRYLREKDPAQKAFLKNQFETKHSLISAIATYFAVEEFLKDKEIKDKRFATFLPIVSFLSVRRHHTNLQSAAEDLKPDSIKNERLKNQIDNLYSNYLSFLPYWNNVSKELKKLPTNWPLKKLTLLRFLEEEKSILPYLIQHLLYSLLLDADRHEVAVESRIERRTLPANLIESYRKHIGFDTPKSQLDILRNEIYQRVFSQAEVIDIDQDHILSFSAPTGSGKTLTALAFAIELRNKIIEKKKHYPRIIYSLPFLSIIDQNAQIIEEVIKTSIRKDPTSDLFLIHHHLTDYSYKKEDTEYGHDESEILIEGWDSEIIITTFVQLFHTLFSNRNRAIRKFHKIAGSIIILDEVQSFPHQYWLLFREFGKAMGKYLDTYFILTTATQPAIFNDTKELLPEKEKYFRTLNRTQITINTSTTVRLK
jgi:CRISPR-associated endonuclease/helicase Cas3